MALVKLHGTSGSGKSTVARGLMEMAHFIKPILSVRGKPECYECHLPDLVKPLFIIGPYETACGGMDAVGDPDDQTRLIDQAAGYGHVFYEGLLGSTYYGKMGKFTEQWGNDHIFAFLDTPMEICISRVKERRLAAGDHRPFNEENTRKRQKSIDNLLKSLRFKLGRRTQIIDYTDAVRQIRGLYGR